MKFPFIYYYFVYKDETPVIVNNTSKQANTHTHTYNSFILLYIFLPRHRHGRLKLSLSLFFAMPSASPPPHSAWSPRRGYTVELSRMPHPSSALSLSLSHPRVHVHSTFFSTARECITAQCWPAACVWCIYIYVHLIYLAIPLSVARGYITRSEKQESYPGIQPPLPGISLYFASISLYFTYARLSLLSVLPRAAHTAIRPSLLYLPTMALSYILYTRFFFLQVFCAFTICFLCTINERRITTSPAGTRLYSLGWLGFVCGGGGGRVRAWKRGEEAPLRQFSAIRKSVQRLSSTINLRASDDDICEPWPRANISFWGPFLIPAATADGAQWSFVQLNWIRRDCNFKFAQDLFYFFVAFYMFYMRI